MDRILPYFRVIFFFGVLPALILDTLSSLREYETQSTYTYNYDIVTENQRQLDCLTKNVYYEAGTEPFEGKLAVAQVTVNRSKHKDFPSDICDVVQQKSFIKNRLVCQFSWYCDINYQSRPINFDRYQEAREAATMVLLDGKELKNVNDALYFHADYVSPEWKKARIVKIGHHIFYR